MSGAITFGATITGGIQDIAGLLPLLGTEQCEEHIGSALTNGYLYAAATPMSLFGSLGVARAGFKTLIACMSGRTWSGAKILANMGFEPKGINLSLVMIDKNDKGGRHLAETRLDELVKELHIDKSRVTVSHQCIRWNVTMILLTVLFSSMSMIPYIHINRQGSKLSHFSQWTFPILRAVGGFLTASMIPLVLQRRISRLVANRLSKLNTPMKTDHTESGDDTHPPGFTGTSIKRPPMAEGTRRQRGAVDTGLRSTPRHASHDSRTGDLEKAVPADSASDGMPTTSKDYISSSPPHHTPSESNGGLDWILFSLLLAGILSSVVGYVGCFSVVQNAKLRTGPFSWLCLEGGLSVIRMILWGMNPKGDDAPPLELVLKLDHETILPTCNLDDAHILQQKVLPLTRGNQFLNMITSFAGLVERFTHPDLTLYYTLTRRKPVIHTQNAGNRVLFITIFDHKERTTRVYTRDRTTEHFYSTETDAPLIDLRHGLLDTKLDKEIISKDDLIAGDPEIRSLLRKHYQSIMDQIHFTLGETYDASASMSPLPPSAYTIETKWTLKAADTTGARDGTRRADQIKSFGRTWELTVERGRIIEVDGSHTTSQRDRLYLGHGRTARNRRSLDRARGQWNESYMELVTRESRDRLEDEITAVRRVDWEPTEHNRIAGGKALHDEELNPKVALSVVEEGLIEERSLMEKLLVYEVEAWEGLVWNQVKEFMSRSDVPESGKEQLTKEWRGNCWKRLDSNISDMDARMERAKAKISALPSNELQSTLLSHLKDAHDEIRRAWQSVIERLVDTLTTVSLPSSAPESRFNRDIEMHAPRIDRYPWRSYGPARLEQERKRYREMAHRLKKELADVKFCMAQGLEHCDNFSDDEELLRCRHSRSKLLSLNTHYLEAPLRVYFRALKGNDHVIHIDFSCYSDEEYANFAEMICHLPSSVTSIRVGDRQRLPSMRRDAPLFIYDHADTQPLETFLNSDESLGRSRDTFIFMKRAYGWTINIAVSFVGPSSGHLILRLKHRVHEPNNLLNITFPGTPLTLSVSGSLTTDDIKLYPVGNLSAQLCFVPSARNNVFIQTSAPIHGFPLQDLQLLDEEGNPYGQPSHRNILAPEFDAPSMPNDLESREPALEQECPYDDFVAD